MFSCLLFSHHWHFCHILLLMNSSIQHIFANSSISNEDNVVLVCRYSNNPKMQCRRRCLALLCFTSHSSPVQVAVSLPVERQMQVYLRPPSLINHSLRCTSKIDTHKMENIVFVKSTNQICTELYSELIVRVKSSV